ncbi:hypothetical protein IFM89_015598 [Coptis chinensis]|uniref:Uncharacterized protein n=1 Tax=Coptis chinensis TaxID=261450 RepID=A0A835I552_9MAGN|nr:hypothetical protein IFM89_015598 [Coptis chinensis]
MEGRIVDFESDMKSVDCRLESNKDKEQEEDVGEVDDDEEDSLLINAQARDDVRLSPNGLLVNELKSEVESGSSQISESSFSFDAISCKLESSNQLSWEQRTNLELQRHEFDRNIGALSCNHGEEEENATEVVRYGMMDEMKATVNTPRHRVAIVNPQKSGEDEMELIKYLPEGLRRDIKSDIYAWI